MSVSNSTTLVDHWGRYVRLPSNLTLHRDLDGDGSVGVSDMLELFSQWGNDGSADFDDSDAIGTIDLLILFANWGLCE